MHVAIVGGGITGLAVARELVHLGHQVTLIERDRIGGLAGGFSYPGMPNTYLERFYHHLFTSDRWMQQLIEEEGLGRRLIWRPTLSGLVAEGQLWPMRGALDLLRFRPAGSLLDRLRLGWALLILRRTRHWAALDPVTCEEFFRKYGALEGYRRLWLPLLRAKFADYAEEASAAFLWGRVVPRAGSRRGMQEHLGYLRGGFQHLFDRMAESLRQRGARIVSGQEVTALRPGPTCHLTLGQETIVCDRVVWTASIGLLCKILEQSGYPCTGFAPPARDYMAVTVLILALSAPLSPYYWLNSIDSSISFGAVIEHTNLVPPEDYAGEHIVYVVNYHLPGDKRFENRGPEDLLAYHQESLRRLFPNYDRAGIRRMWVCRDRFASPVYRAGFGRSIPAYRGAVEGVDVCNMAQVYPVDRNMNHCIWNAQKYVKSCYGDVVPGGTGLAE